MFDRLDHLIVVVADLSAAVNDYSKVFGFPPTWRGKHEKLGTENALFPVQNTYLELLASSGKGSGSDMVNSILKTRGEGLSGIAFGTKNIETLKNQLSEKGLKTGGIVTGVGVDLNENKSRSWRNLFFSPDIMRDLFLFAIEHGSGELPTIETNHSQINRLDHVVVHSNDPEGFISLYRDMFDIRLSLDQTIEEWGGRMLFFRLNKTTLEVIGKKDSEKKIKDSFWGLAWDVDDLAQAHQRLVNEGVEVTDIRNGRKPDTLVCTVKSHTLGVPTLLIEHLDRT